MNMDKFKFEIENQYIDSDGLVRSNATNVNSGNGLLYSAVYFMIRTFYGNPSQADVIVMKSRFNEMIKSCMYEYGVIERNPEDTFGQESWDDYLGIAVGCILLGETTIPREILWHGIKNGFFFRNVPDSGWSSFLGRFPQVWILMWLAAFPFLRFTVVVPLLVKFIGSFQNAPVNDDQSGLQLQWVYHIGAQFATNSAMGDYDGWVQTARTIKGRQDFLSDAFSRYYGVDMPFTWFTKELGL